MPNVIRFVYPGAVSSGLDVFVAGVGMFFKGVHDVLADDVSTVAAVRAIVLPGAIELGPLDPTLVFPPSQPLIGDPYPQYVADADLLAEGSAPLNAIRADSGTYTGDHTWTGSHDFVQAPTVNGAPIGLEDAVDATSSTKGVVRLAGDLGGTAANPTVLGLSQKIGLAEKGVANGVATLGVDGKIPSTQLPSVAISDFLGVVASQAAMLALIGQRGDWTTRSDLDANFILTTDDPTQLTSWRQISSPGGVTSVASRTGAVVLIATDISDSTSVGRSVLKATDSAAARTAIGSAATTHTHNVTDLNITGTPDGTKFLADDNSWQVPAAGGAMIYSTVKWDSATSTWPSRPAVPSGVPVLWMSVRYATAGAPPGALADDIWYPHADELT